MLYSLLILENKKGYHASAIALFYCDLETGRSGGIRTHDLFHPKEALYQTEPRPESQGVLY